MADYGRSGVFAAWRFLQETTPLYADWPLRLAFSAIFLYHGIEHVRDAAGFAEMMDLSLSVAWAVGLAELAAGIGVLIGGIVIPGAALMTRLGGLAAAVVMVGAIYRVHWDRWAFTATEEFPMGGMEFQLLAGLIGIWFFVTAGLAEADA